MKKPSPPGTPVTMPRMRGWVTDFSGYRHAVTEPRVERWLSQFDLPHIDLAARVLDCVDFVGSEKISTTFRTSLESLPGWHRDEARRSGIWRFAAFSTSAGESGDVMLQKFRHANNLASRRYNSLFVHRSELLKAGLRPEDHIVFVDDFAGSGKQATNAWPLLKEFLPEGPDVHLLLVAATRKAVDRITKETELLVQSEIVLGESDAIFSDACNRFTPQEKQTLATYCQRAASSGGSKYGQDGYVIVFSHTCPNNSLPILHGQTNDWEGLFRRYDAA